MLNLYFNHSHFGLPILKKYGFVEYSNCWQWTCYVFLPNGKDSYTAQIKFYKNLNQLEIFKNYGTERINISSALKLSSLIENKIKMLFKDNIIAFDDKNNENKYLN